MTFRTLTLLAVTAMAVLLAGCGVITTHVLRDKVQDNLQEHISRVSENAIVVQRVLHRKPQIQPYAVDPTPESDIYVIDQDATNEARSIHAAENEAGAVLSPDGENIAFLRTDSVVTDVYVMNPNGTHKTQITTNNPFRDLVRTVRGQPAWSPDSERVAFTSYTVEEISIPSSSASPVDAPAEEVNGIYVANASGLGVPRMIHDFPEKSLPGEAPTSNLTWSPDGDKIAFYDGVAIYVFKHDDDGQWDLIYELESAEPPHSWSPDGKRIAFVGMSDRDLYVINADGSGRKHLANTISYSSGFNAFPTWSPDGKMLAFFCPAHPRSEGSDLCMVSADGTAWQRFGLDVD